MKKKLSETYFYGYWNKIQMYKFLQSAVGWWSCLKIHPVCYIRHVYERLRYPYRWTACPAPPTVWVFIDTFNIEIFFSPRLWLLAITKRAKSRPTSTAVCRRSRSAHRSDSFRYYTHLVVPHAFTQRFAISVHTTTSMPVDLFARRVSVRIRCFQFAESSVYR